MKCVEQAYHATIASFVARKPVKNPGVFEAAREGVGIVADMALVFWGVSEVVMISPAKSK